MDKSISILRIAMTRLSNILSDLYDIDGESEELSKRGVSVTNGEDDWILYETLLYHKNMLHQQIDHLIKEKYKLERNK